MKNFHEETVARKTIYSGKIIDVYLDEVRLPDGKQAKREIVKHPGAVAVIPITNEGKIVMVRQFRKALERHLVEIPAGKLEKGEAPETTAKRELEEETGLECDSLTPIMSFYTSPGFADEIIHLYLAEGLRQLEEKASLDEDEFVDVIEVTLEEAQQLIADQEIYDAKTVYAVQYLLLKQLREKNE